MAKTSFWHDQIWWSDQLRLSPVVRNFVRCQECQIQRNDLQWPATCLEPLPSLPLDTLRFFLSAVGILPLDPTMSQWSNNVPMIIFQHHWFTWHVCHPDPCRSMPWSPLDSVALFFHAALWLGRDRLGQRMPCCSWALGFAVFCPNENMVWPLKCQNWGHIWFL